MGIRPVSMKKNMANELEIEVGACDASARSKKD
jgi:hypothetical protein